MIDLKSILEQHPNCLNSRASFKSVLMDLYPSEKRTVNLLASLLECGIAGKIRAKKSIDADEMRRLIAQIENEYGISGQYAQDAIMIWAAAFDVTISAVKVNVTTETAAQQPSKPIVTKPVVYVQGDVDDYEVVQKADGYYITRFNGFEEEEMTIPSMIDGKKIKGIAEDVFHGCAAVKKIHISEGIEIIENRAFRNCTALEDMDLPDTLRRMGSKIAGHGDGVFSGAGLRAITIPKNVEFLGSDIFSVCLSLKNVELPDRITTIQECAFSWCINLSEIKFPNSLTVINKEAFWNCVNLSKIKLPSSLVTIGKKAFWNCCDLSEIELPCTLITIAEAAFEGCSSLHEVHIPVGTQKIGKNAFKGAELTAIYIPPTVTEIGEMGTFSWNDETLGNNSGMTIYCAAGSVAMEYARKHGIKCAKAQF